MQFLIQQGLKKRHKVLDLGCGSLRLGVKLIPFLEKECYFGVEKEPLLIKAGIEHELDKNSFQSKIPTLIVSDKFEFTDIKYKIDFAIAQSLFTHIPEKLINLCFKNLYIVLEKEGKFFATFHLVKYKNANPLKPHAFGFFGYTENEILTFGKENSFRTNIIGEWGHPRDQIIVEYKKK